MNTRRTRYQFSRCDNKRHRRHLRLEALEDRRLLATLTVTNLDEGLVTGPGNLPGSLRQAIYDCNQNPGADEIVWQSGLAGTITLTHGELQVTEDLNITGLGDDQTTIDAAGNSRVMKIDDGDNSSQFDVTLSGLTISGGRTTSHGAGIWNTENLVLTESAVLNNSAVGRSQGGGIWSTVGTLTVVNSTLSGNSSTHNGGAIWTRNGDLVVINSTISDNVVSNNVGIAGGAGIQAAYANVTVDRSTISGNSGASGDGASFGGGIEAWQGSHVVVTDSTISGNTADWGGGIAFDGADASITMTIRNSSVSGNVANLGGGGIAQGNGDLIVRNSTVTANTAQWGGGIATATEWNASTDIGSSIVSGNVNSDVHYDLFYDPGPPNYGENRFHSSGYNLIGTGNGLPAFSNNDLTGVTNPMLGALADNGGPTLTHAVLPGSPALNAVDPDFGSPPDFDQRGDPFARVFDGRIDIGSFESQPFVVDGDFNDDGLYDCLDIDALVAQIAAGTNGLAFDLTGDGVVDLADRDGWLADAGAVNLPSGTAYLLGDATLDGVVDVSDFNVWNGNKFTAFASWCSGDFNADRSIDVSDFNIWNENKFQSSDGSALSATSPIAIGQWVSATTAGQRDVDHRSLPTALDGAIQTAAAVIQDQPSALVAVAVDATFARWPRTAESDDTWHTTRHSVDEPTAADMEGEVAETDLLVFV